MIGLRREGEKKHDGLREREREKKQCMCLYDESESQADCTSKHVPPCYHTAHFLEQSEQAIKEMGQQE